MTNSKMPFNPARFADMLEESLYAIGPKGEKLKSKREDLVAWLRKKCKNSQACLDLADKLADCRRKHRCKSAACPECAAAGQQLVARAARHFLKAQAGSSKIVCVSVVPDDGVSKPGKLFPSELPRAVRRWKEKMGKAGGTWFVGAIDISFNEHKQARFTPHWSVHFYGITATDGHKKLKRELRKLFPKTKTIRRPVTVVEWDRDVKALRYILKPNFGLRIGNDNGQRYDKKTGTMRSCRDTDTQPLRSKRKRELLLYLDDVGIQGQLVMRQGQLLNLKGQAPTIVMRRPGGRGRGSS